MATIKPAWLLVILSGCGANRQQQPPQPIAASPTRLWVAAAGDDKNPCSEARPCRELAAAVARAPAGAEIVVGDGTYQRVTLQGRQRLTIRATGDNARVVGDAGCGMKDPVCRDAIAILDSSDIEIDGLRVADATRAGIFLEYSPRVTIRNCVVGPNGKWAIFTGFSDDTLIEKNEAFGSRLEHGIYVSNSSDRPIIRENRVHGNHACGIQINADWTCKPEAGRYGGVTDGITTGAVISKNTIYDNGTAGGAAINLDGVQNSEVSGNLIYNNRGRGIVNYGDRDRLEDDDEHDGWGKEGPKGMNIDHNVVAMPTGARHGLLFRFSVGPSTVRHNVLLHADKNRGGLELAQPADEAFLDSDQNVIERIAVDTEKQPPTGTVLSLAEWQKRGKDKHSTLPSAEVRDSTLSYGH